MATTLPSPSDSGCLSPAAVSTADGGSYTESPDSTAAEGALACIYDSTRSDGGQLTISVAKLVTPSQFSDTISTADNDFFNSTPKSIDVGGIGDQAEFVTGRSAGGAYGGTISALYVKQGAYGIFAAAGPVASEAQLERVATAAIKFNI